MAQMCSDKGEMDFRIVSLHLRKSASSADHSSGIWASVGQAAMPDRSRSSPGLIVRHRCLTYEIGDDLTAEGVG